MNIPTKSSLGVYWRFTFGAEGFDPQPCIGYGKPWARESLVACPRNLCWVYQCCRKCGQGQGRKIEKLTALRSSLNGLQSRWRWSQVDILRPGSVPWLWCLNVWQCSTPTGTNLGHSPVQTCLDLGSMMVKPYKPVVSCHCFAQPIGTLVYLVNIQPWEIHETSGLPNPPQSLSLARYIQALLHEDWQTRWSANAHPLRVSECSAVRWRAAGVN